MSLLRQSAAAGSSLNPIAAFMGIGQAKKPKEAKPADEKPAAEDDPDAAANQPAPEAKTLDEDEQEEEDGEGGDEDDETGDDESDERDMRKSKKTKSARAARMRERARIAAILGHPKAAANPNFAAQIALKTNLTRSQAMDMLATAPAVAAPRTGLSDMMAHVPGAPSANAPQPQPVERAKGIVADAFTAVADKMAGKKA